MKILTVALRFPSKGTQYGYAEAVVEFDGDWYKLGHEYREAVLEFQQGEAAQQNTQAATKVKQTVVDPAEMIKQELGATDITDLVNEDVEEETPEWENPPPAPSDDDWDF